MFDQYISARVLDKYPQLYRLGQSDTFYNHKVFIGWILNSFFHSFGLFYVWCWIIGDGDVLSGGRVIDNWTFGAMVYITTLFTVLLKHCLIADTYVGLTTFAFIGSLAAFMFLFPLVSILVLILVYHCWPNHQGLS